MPGILSKTDKALAAYLISQGIGDSNHTVPFKGSDEKELPVYICHSTHGVPVAGFDGTWEVQSTILTRTISAVDINETTGEKVDSSDFLVEAVHNAFMRFGDRAQSGNDLGEAITQAAQAAGVSDFTCQHAELSGIECSVLWSRDSNAWEDALTLKLIVCPSNVS